MATILNFIACCTAIVDLGSQESRATNALKISREIALFWEVTDEQSNDIFKHKFLYKTYLMSWDKNSPLREDIERWNGGALTDDQQRRFSPKSLLNKYHSLKLEKTSDDSCQPSYKVKKVDPLPADIDIKTLPKPHNPFRMFMISDPDMEFFDQLPKEIQEKIKLSPEFQWAQKAATDDEYE